MSETGSEATAPPTLVARESAGLLRAGMVALVAGVALVMIGTASIPAADVPMDEFTRDPGAWPHVLRYLGVAAALGGVWAIVAGVHSLASNIDTVARLAVERSRNED